MDRGDNCDDRLVERMVDFSSPRLATLILAELQLVTVALSFEIESFVSMPPSSMIVSQPR
jgi:hypothetical protein